MDMAIGEIVQFVFNNGLAVVLIFYYLKNNNQTIKDLVKSNTEVTSKLAKLVENQNKILEKQEKIYNIIDKCKKAV